MSRHNKLLAGRNGSTQRSALSEMPDPAALESTSSGPRGDPQAGVSNDNVEDQKAEVISHDLPQEDSESDSEDEEEEDTAAMMPVDDSTRPNFHERVDLGHASADEAVESAKDAENVPPSKTRRLGGSEIEHGSDSEMSSEEEQAGPAELDSEDEEEETEDEDEDDNEEEEPSVAASLPVVRVA